MKTRQGFVSNSSSSSFIIGFDKRPKNAAELQKVMFPEGGSQTVQMYDSPHYPADQVAATVFNDITGKRKLTKEQILEELESGYFKGMPEYPSKIWSLDGKAYEDAMTKYKSKCREAAEKIFNDLMTNNGDKVFLRVEYSDNDGQYYCTLEHGDIFRNITHIQVSHH